MNLEELNAYYEKFKFGEDNFHNLMQKRVREILFVSTFYDAFIFEQDGRLSEQIFGEYRQLNLSTAPRITSVPTGTAALKKLEESEYNLVILMMRIGEMSPFELSKIIKEKYPDLPVLLLLNIQSDLAVLEDYKAKLDHIDDVFIWNGDTKLFLAIVKSVEDKLNLKYDTENGMVRVILLVEDSIYYYSLFLPLLYTEIMKQTQRLIDEELNETNKRMRMRARPKVILVHNYEDAWKYYQEYKDYLLCVISDVRYKMEQVIDPEAGIKLIRKIVAESPDIPVILQSSELVNETKARELNVTFLHKNSKNMLHALTNFIMDNLGFGPFIFRGERGDQIGVAEKISDFQEQLANISDESLLFHSRHNHFSTWLIAHGEIQIAKRIQPLTINDFRGVTSLRVYLLSVFEEVKTGKGKGKIINFEVNSLNQKNQIVRLSEGSFGGKGRGLAFLNSMLATMEYETKFEKARIVIPSTAIIGTNEFDMFLSRNGFNLNQVNLSDEEIDLFFLQGELSELLLEKLRIYLEQSTQPLAVRSSGLLEDSQSQSFAGVYRTFLIPNNSVELETRLNQITDAIKLVFASIFLESSRKYIEGINFKLEEEKMAVIIQEVVGERYGDLFFPLISGVAQSYNCYPSGRLKHQDGVVSMAVGLGKSIVEREKVYSFCPKYPKVEFFRTTEMVENSQQHFYAINCAQEKFDLSKGEDETLVSIEITKEFKNYFLKPLTSIWDYENKYFVDSDWMEGPRVLTFRNVTHFNNPPVSEIVSAILEFGELSMGAPVEIEFAMCHDEVSKKYDFYLLQIRPLTVNEGRTEVNLEEIERSEVMLISNHSLGNGVIEGIKDVIFVSPGNFDNTKTLEMKVEIDYFNEKMKKSGKNYILISEGRWGSSDRFLGIPVKWGNISKAKVIVEIVSQNKYIEASHGSHFFHNVVSMNVGYLTVSAQNTSDLLDWNWLEAAPIEEKLNFVTHVSFSEFLEVRIDGKKGIAVIVKS